MPHGRSGQRRVSCCGCIAASFLGETEVPAWSLPLHDRCRELLSIVLGLEPSARAEALAARIAGR